MKTKYIAVWKLYGANKLANDSNLELIRLDNPTLVSLVTASPDSYFQHIDQAAAIANSLLKGMTGLFADDEGGTAGERISRELEKVKASRAERTSDGVFLVLEGETDVQNPNFEIRKEGPKFAVCFDAVDKAEIRERFRPSIHVIMTAITLSLSANVERQLELVGEVIYLVETDSKKPIYTFTAEFGAPRLSVMSPLTGGVISDAATRIPKLLGDKALRRPASLLITSLNRATDSLQAFIAAWSALEIFVNATFKTTYESQWFGIMESGAPGAAKPVFARFKEVMSDKYRLADKFLIITSVLDANAATIDAGEFNKLKSVRDDLLHGLDIPAHLPTEAVQALLTKYLLLHVDRSDS